MAERWVRTVRAECLDPLRILGAGHLRRVLKEYIVYYNMHRPHQGRGQHCPLPLALVPTDGRMQRRDVLGGILHDYFRAAA